MALQRDSRLGKYIIRERIGAGGMGVVYKARDAVLGREVAIKTIIADKATDRGFVSRFRREAFAISNIRHPHIVQLLDFVEADPDHDQPAFMVMEFLPGHDLGWVIRNDGPLAVPRAVDRIIEAVAAVAACHRLGYIHRDLKPNNIFLAEYDQIERTKVLDFGAAKLEERREEGEGDEVSELTKKGTFLGTPFYMPPELISGGAATPKADQYSLAVVLYTALAGVKPFDLDKKKEHKEVDLLQSIVNGQYKPLRSLRSDVPDGLADVIKKAMEVSPADRHFDLHTFGAELRQWASPSSSLIWEAHFTSSAPAKVVPQISIALPAALGLPVDYAGRARAPMIEDPTSVDRTMLPTDTDQNTNPTELTRPDPARTIPISTKELRLVAGASVTGPAANDTDNLPSISIEFHDPHEQVPSGATPLNTPARRSSSARFIRRPGFILLAAGSALGIALATSVLFSHAKPQSPPALVPPADLFARPAPPSARPPPRPVPTEPPPAPSSPTAIAAPAPQPDTTTPARPSAQKRPVHKHRQRLLLDKNGLAIPSD